MVDPSIMCRKHLLGEHVELHMFVGSINNGINIRGYIRDNLCEPSSIRSRHEELVDEMIKRGYKHNSPLPEFCYVDKTLINTSKSLAELLSRCKECNNRYDSRIK